MKVKVMKGSVFVAFAALWMLVCLHTTHAHLTPTGNPLSSSPLHPDVVRYLQLNGAIDEYLGVEHHHFEDMDVASVCILNRSLLSGLLGNAFQTLSHALTGVVYCAQYVVEEMNREKGKSEKYDLSKIVKAAHVHTSTSSEHAISLVVMHKSTPVGVDATLKVDQYGPRIETLFKKENYRCDPEGRAAHCEECNVYGHCKTGSVPVNSWLAYALNSQRQLQRDRPMNEVEFLQAHNAYNTRANGYGLDDNIIGRLVRLVSHNNTQLVVANQEFSLTDMLNMGIRALELDLHWFNGKIRLCHAGGINAPWLDKLIKDAGKVLNTTIDFGTGDLGCGPWDRPYEDGIKEIAKWLHNNPNEVINLYFEDHYRYTFNHDDLVINPLKEYLGDLILRTSDKPSGRWPSIGEMNQLGKQVFIGTGDVYGTHGSDLIFPPFWIENSAKHFTKYPKCGGQANQTEWTRFYTDEAIYGPYWNGPTIEGVINSTNLPFIVNCNVNFIGMDMVDPSLMSAAVWSWAPTQPHPSNMDGSFGLQTNQRSGQASGTSCTSMQKDGRWALLPCDTLLPVACQDTTTGGYVVGSATAPFASASNSCADGQVFGVPLDGYMNHKLALVVGEKGSSNVWINHTV